MSQNRLPTIKDPLADLAIKPMEEIEEQVEVIQQEIQEPPVGATDVFGKEFKKKNIKLEKKEIVKDEIKDNLPNSLQTIEEEVPQKRRGKDKVKRKKKVMSQSQLDALARGRAKSLATRQAKAAGKTKKAEPIKMPAPEKNTKLDYDTFSNYMDMYEEKRKKKHSTSKNPHPNRVINQRHRPVAPPSKPRVAKWTGNIGSFAQHKTGGGRWNYGI